MDLAGWLFPKACLGCKTSGKYMCHTCLSHMRQPSSSCFVCGCPTVDFRLHPKCRLTMPLHGVVIAWTYTGVIRAAISAIKFKFVADACDELSHAFGAHIDDCRIGFSSDSVLVPIPLNTRRMNMRGFNQTEIVGGYLAKRMGWQYNNSLLVRRRNTAYQVGLGRQARRANVRGCFDIDPKAVATIDKHSTVIIFDDVITTGATMGEAAGVLWRYGFSTIWGLAIAT